VSGALCYQGSPIWWASKHRRHHKYCDTPEDPHSWLQTSHWYAWWGWTIHPAEQKTDHEYVGAFSRQPELVIVSRLWPLWPVLFAALVRHYGGFYCMVCYATTPMLMSRFITLLFNTEFHPVHDNPTEGACKGVDLASFFADLMGEACHDHHHKHPRALCRPSAGFPYFDVPYYLVIAPLLRLGLIWTTDFEAKSE